MTNQSTQHANRVTELTAKHHGETPKEYPTCDACRAKLSKQGDSFKCVSCGLSRQIFPGEVVGL